MSTKSEIFISSKLKSLGFNNNNIRNTMLEIKNRVNSNENLSVEEQSKLFRKLQNTYKDKTYNNKPITSRQRDNFSRKSLNSLLKNIEKARKEHREQVFSELYYEFEQDYFDIFKKVCTYRQDELHLVNEAKNKKRKFLMDGNDQELANFKAFENLRNYKNNQGYNKEIMYNKLENLEERVTEIISKRNVPAFFDKMVNTSALFIKFMEDNLKCNARIHPSQNYKGLKKYLKHGKNRPEHPNVKNRKTINQIKNNIKRKQKNKKIPKKGRFKKGERIM